MPGLVGLPNAGKSTFINAVSNAQAKVGDYAFTTLVPKLGVVRHKGREFVLADIPGLIEGAADGAGIGDRFLGHIERCRVLIHLIDIGGMDPAEAMRVIEDELAAYGAGLDDKPRLVALNKIDLADAELAGDFAEELKAAGAADVFPISGATGEGIEALLDAVLSYLPDADRDRASRRRGRGCGRREALVAALTLPKHGAQRLSARHVDRPSRRSRRRVALCPRLVDQGGLGAACRRRWAAAAGLARFAGCGNRRGAGARGQQVIVVSSGAIALGAARLGLDKGGRSSLADAQAAAARGPDRARGIVVGPARQPRPRSPHNCS